MDEVFDGGKSSSTEDTEKVSQAMKYLHLLNIMFGIYGGFIGLSLLAFAVSMHGQVMKNVTTNESLRQKWNASKVMSDQDATIQPSKWARTKQFYMSDLPKSRLERFFELNDEIITSFASEHDSGNLKAKYESERMKTLSELDNYHVLLEYGIDTRQAGKFKAQIKSPSGQ